MNRGKRQILFGFLPEKTFDFEKVDLFARVSNIRGLQRTDLNMDLVVHKIRSEARSWDQDYRPFLRDDVLTDSSRFVLIDPATVEADLYPQVFWCTNKNCGRVIRYTDGDALPPRVCPECGQGSVRQLRWIRIHRCGAMMEMIPPRCSNCHTDSHIALDLRDSEHISGFRWICRRCNQTMSLYGSGAYCPECNWPSGDANDRRMEIQVHRAGRTYYPQFTVILNIPDQRLSPLLENANWAQIVGARYLNIPLVSGQSLTDIVRRSRQAAAGSEVIDAATLDELLARRASGEITDAEFVEEMANLRSQPTSSTGLGNILNQQLTELSGLEEGDWQGAGQELLEAIMPYQLGSTIPTDNPNSATLGIQSLSLCSDFPILTAVYGYSRCDYTPNQCWLRPFPPHADHGGRFPVFVDQVQADALLVRLDPHRVLRWLESNNYSINLPRGTSSQLSEEAYFIRLFNDVAFGNTFQSDQPILRMVFGLIHTLSHAMVREAALLCGLDRTSLSEHLLPRSLSFAIYCNHRFGATIGALTALFEQSLTELLQATITTGRRCVYDPVCKENESSCHACTHLPETSCRHFNLNLSRALLFGGRDPVLGDIREGFLSNALTALGEMNDVQG